MSGVKNFLRRLSFKEPKKTQPKSASTPHLAQKFQTQQQDFEDSNIPYCLRQRQLEGNNTNNTNSNNNDNNINNYKELSKSQNHVIGRGTKQDATYINNLGSDNHHHNHHPNHRRTSVSSQSLSLKAAKHADKDSVQSSDRCLTLQYRPRYQPSTDFSNGRRQEHRAGSDIVIRNPSASLHNLRPKVTNAESRFKDVS